MIAFFETKTLEMFGKVRIVYFLFSLFLYSGAIRSDILRMFVIFKILHGLRSLFPVSVEEGIRSSVTLKFCPFSTHSFALSIHVLVFDELTTFCHNCVAVDT